MKYGDTTDNYGQIKPYGLKNHEIYAPGSPRSILTSTMSTEPSTMSTEASLSSPDFGYREVANNIGRLTSPRTENLGRVYEDGCAPGFSRSPRTFGFHDHNASYATRDLESGNSLVESLELLVHKLAQLQLNGSWGNVDSED